MDDNNPGNLVFLTAEEADSLADLLSNHLVEIIRSDLDIDNINYVANLIHVWEGCSAAAKEYRYKKSMDFLNGCLNGKPLEAQA